MVEMTNELQFECIQNENIHICIVPHWSLKKLYKGIDLKKCMIYLNLNEERTV